MKHHILPTILLLAPLVAQTPTQPPAAAPTTVAAIGAPHLLLDTVGPDGWRMRLGPTNLGALLASEKGRALWQPHVLPMLGQANQLLGGQDTGEAAMEHLLGHQGRVRVGVWFDLEARWLGEAAAVAVLIEGDGRTDLARLAGDLRGVLEKAMPGEPGSLELGGASRDLRTHEDDTLVLPFVDGANVLLVVGPQSLVPAVFAAARQLGADATGKPPRPNTSALRVQVDLAALLPAWKRQEGEGDARMMDALGFDSLGTLSFEITAAGPHVQFELAQQFTRDERGLFAAVLPGTPGVPDDRALVPSGAGSWKLGRFDFQGLYQHMLRAIASQEADGVEELSARLQEELGLDVDKDLLAHTTDAVLFAHEPIEELERPNDLSWVFGLGLRDEAAFTAGLTKLLTKAKGFLNHAETTTVDGVQTHRYGFAFGYDLWLCVTGKHLFLCGGRNGAELLAKTIAATKRPAETPAPADQLAELRRHLPAGCNGHARTELGGFLALPLDWWIGPWAVLGFDGMPADGPADDDEAQEGRRAMLKDNHLDVLRTATGYAERTFRWRIWW